MKANAGYWKLPVAIISNGNTVKNTEYSFLANVLAADGYLVASIQQDLPSDPPLMTKVGQPYVGRLQVYEIVGVLREIFGVSDHDLATYTSAISRPWRLLCTVNVIVAIPMSNHRSLDHVFKTFSRYFSALLDREP